MVIKALLQQHKTEIVDKWIHAVVNAYPGETARFLDREKDPFNNPVGATLKEALTAVIDAFIEANDPEAMEKALLPFIKIRSVQCKTPAEAVSFVFLLKKVLKEILKDQATEDLYERVDGLALAAFNVHAGCKDKLHALSLEGERRQVAVLLKKHGYITETMRS